MQRLFFALELMPDDIEQVARLQQAIWLDKGTKVAPANFHVTLAFLGQTSEAQKQALCEFASGIQAEPFSLKFTHLGHFEKAKVLWLGPEHKPASLMSLAQGLTQKARELGIAQSHREYRPHLTLYRHAQALAQYQGEIDFTLSFDHFSLMESKSSAKGVVYQALQSWSLQGEQKP